MRKFLSILFVYFVYFIVYGGSKLSEAKPNTYLTKQSNVLVRFDDNDVDISSDQLYLKARTLSSSEENSNEGDIITDVEENAQLLEISNRAYTKILEGRKSSIYIGCGDFDSSSSSIYPSKQNILPFSSDSARKEYISYFHSKFEQAFEEKCTNYDSTIAKVKSLSPVGLVRIVFKPDATYDNIKEVVSLVWSMDSYVWFIDVPTHELSYNPIQESGRRESYAIPKPSSGNGPSVSPPDVGPEFTCGYESGDFQHDQSPYESAPVNNEHFRLQWHLWNDLHPEYDIDATKFWYATRCRSHVTQPIAIVDSGYNIKLPQLTNQLWSNPHEIPNNGIDDDGNGYIDDVNGWDFPSDSNIMTDDNLNSPHGSLCASAAAGEYRPGKAQSMSMAQHVKIVPLVAYSRVPDDMIDSIAYTLLFDEIRIVTMSFAYLYQRKADDHPLYALIFGAIGESDKLVILAAGNESEYRDTIDNPDPTIIDQYFSYPQRFKFPNFINVGSTNIYGHITWFSNYGNPYVDIFAPGECLTMTQEDYSFRYMYGTSFSGPMVAGIAGEILSLMPHLTTQQLKETLLNSCSIDYSKIGPDYAVCPGIINSYKALQYAEANFPAN